MSTQKTSLESRMGAQIVSSLVGATIGGIVGSQTLTSTSDVRYGGAVFGGLVGIFILPVVVVLLGDGLTALVGLGSLYMLFTTLTAHDFGLGLGILVLVVMQAFFIPIALAYLGGRAGGPVPSHLTGSVNDFRRARGILDPLRGQYYRPGHKLTPGEQADIEAHRNELEEAIRLFESARRGRLSTAPSIDEKQDAAVVPHEIGLAHRLLGNLEEAKAFYLQAYNELEALYPRTDRYRLRLADQLGVVCLHIGDVEHISGRFSEAAKWYSQSLPLLDEANDATNANLARDLLMEVQQRLP